MDMTSAIENVATVLGITLGVTGAFAAWFNNRRKEDRALWETRADGIEGDLEHLRSNHKTLNQSATAKFEKHGQDLVRLETNQQQQHAAISEIKQELKEGFAKIERDVEKLGESFKAEGDRTREAAKQQMETIIAAMKYASEHGSKT